MCFLMHLKLLSRMFECCTTNEEYRTCTDSDGLDTVRLAILQHNALEVCRKFCRVPTTPRAKPYGSFRFDRLIFPQKISVLISSAETPAQTSLGAHPDPPTNLTYSEYKRANLLSQACRMDHTIPYCILSGTSRDLSSVSSPQLCIMHMIESGDASSATHPILYPPHTIGSQL